MGAFPRDAASPNAGAHALLAWLGEGDQVERRLAVLGLIHINDATVDRLLTGELIPGDDMARHIAKASEGEVLPDHWEIVPGPAWSDAPIVFDPRF